MPKLKKIGRKEVTISIVERGKFDLYEGNFFAQKKIPREWSSFIKSFDRLGPPETQLSEIVFFFQKK